jgi:aminopeptidase 2
MPSIQSDADIRQIFDPLVYKKGCSILQIITSLIGEDKFVQGLAKYLKAHAYQNMVTVDLWSALSEVSGMDRAEMMRPWTEIADFPVIIVETTPKGVRPK